MNSLEQNYNLKDRALVVFIFVVHIAGVIGLQSEYAQLFLAATPFTLIFSFIVVISYTQSKAKDLMIYCSLIVVLGFLIELIGVNTGWPFGVYSYGQPFGLKLGHTPLVIGLNWFVLTYCGAYLTSRISQNKWLNSITSGILITSIDFIIEPVAIKLNYWNWAANEIPIANYVTWFICVTLFTRFIYLFEPRISNKMAPFILAAQVLFFVALNFLL